VAKVPISGEEPRWVGGDSQETKKIVAPCDRKNPPVTCKKKKSITNRKKEIFCGEGGAPQREPKKGGKTYASSGGNGSFGGRRFGGEERRGLLKGGHIEGGEKRNGWGGKKKRVDGSLAGNVSYATKKGRSIGFNRKKRKRGEKGKRKKKGRGSCPVFGGPENFKKRRGGRSKGNRRGSRGVTIEAKKEK